MQNVFELIEMIDFAKLPETLVPIRVQHYKPKLDINWHLWLEPLPVDFSWHVFSGADTIAEMNNSYLNYDRLNNVWLSRLNTSWDFSYTYLAARLIYNNVELPKTLTINLLDNLVQAYDSTTIPSCMQGHGEFYEDFDNNVKFVSVEADGRQVLRCLLWISHKNKAIFIDRLYFTSSSYSTQALNQLYFKAVSEFEGYTVYCKAFNCNAFNLNTGGVESFNDLNDMFKFRFEVERGLVPYMDTFSYGYYDGTYLHYRLTRVNNNYIPLYDTTGRYNDCYLAEPSEGVCRCANCGAYINTDSDYYGDIDGELYCSDCCEHSDLEQCYILTDDAVYLDYCNDYADVANCTEVTDRDLRRLIGAYIYNSHLN